MLYSRVIISALDGGAGKRELDWKVCLDSFPDPWFLTRGFRGVWMFPSGWTQACWQRRGSPWARSCLPAVRIAPPFRTVRTWKLPRPLGSSVFGKNNGGLWNPFYHVLLGEPVCPHCASHTLLFLQMEMRLKAFFFIQWFYFTRVRFKGRSLPRAKNSPITVWILSIKD